MLKKLVVNIKESLASSIQAANAAKPALGDDTGLSLTSLTSEARNVLGSALGFSSYLFIRLADLAFIIMSFGKCASSE